MTKISCYNFLSFYSSRLAFLFAKFAIFTNANFHFSSNIYFYKTLAFYLQMWYCIWKSTEPTGQFIRRWRHTGWFFLLLKFFVIPFYLFTQVGLPFFLQSLQFSQMPTFIFPPTFIFIKLLPFYLQIWYYIWNSTEPKRQFKDGNVARGWIFLFKLFIILFYLFSSFVWKSNTK